MRDGLTNIYNLNEYNHILIRYFRLDNESVETIIYNLLETKLYILQISNNDKNS